MTSVFPSEFRNKQSDDIVAAQRENVEIASRGASRSTVLVSPDFFHRAIGAPEDQEDIRAAAEARKETEPTMSHEELRGELGL